MTPGPAQGLRTSPLASSPCSCWPLHRGRHHRVPAEALARPCSASPCCPASAPAPLRAYGATPRVLQSVPASSWRAARPRRWDRLPPRAPSPRAPPPVNRGRDRVSRLIRNQRAAGSRPHLQGPAQVWLQVWPLASVLTYSPLSPATCVPVDAEAQQGHPVQRAGAPAAQAARSPVCPALTAAAAAPAATRKPRAQGGLELESLKTQKKEEQESARYRRAHRP